MRKLYIDCSFISTTNLNTGIQRVVRKVIENINNICENTSFSPVEVILENNKIKETSILKNKKVLDNDIIPNKDDILLLLDSTWHLDTWGSVKKAKDNGVKVIAVIYDIIPISHPQFCDENLVRLFKKWFTIAIDNVDGFITISQTVQFQLQDYLKEKYPKKIKEKKFDFFHLGADFAYKDFSLYANNIKNEIHALYDSNKDIYLVVCTIEPRKNHKYLLDVFDKLWEKDYDVTLNIVGKKGWMVDDLINRIHSHSQYNKRLFHWDNLNDDELTYCYKNSKMLLFPSFIEGFGLPIIESLNNKLPVLASDIPIHREVGKDYIDYFNLDDITSLESKIINIEKNTIPDNLIIKDDFRWLNWNESTKMLFEKILKMEKKIKVKKVKVKNIKRNNRGEQISSLKQFIKKIPFVSFFARWTYNILRINNLKHRVFISSEEIQRLTNQLQIQSNAQNELVNQLQIQSNTQNELVNQLQIQIQAQNKEISDLKNIIPNEISKEILFQSLSFQQRLDQFIFDSKIDFQNFNKNSDPKIEKLNNPYLELKQINNKVNKTVLNDYYLAFENKFRGERKQIVNRYEKYLDLINIEKVNNSLDVGCGRGEWLELLDKKGIKGLGIDTNASMIKECKENNINNVICQDAFECLAKVDDNTFDLITAFHIIEHIEFESLLKLLFELKRVLKNDGQLVLETPNPKNLLVASLTFYNDPTHLNPIPPEVMKFMVEYVGFNDSKIVELNPFDESFKINEHSQAANMLNNLLFQEQDYLIIAKLNE